MAEGEPGSSLPGGDNLKLTINPPRKTSEGPRGVLRSSVGAEPQSSNRFTGSLAGKDAAGPSEAGLADPYRIIPGEDTLRYSKDGKGGVRVYAQREGQPEADITELLSEGSVVQTTDSGPRSWSIIGLIPQPDGDLSLRLEDFSDDGRTRNVNGITLSRLVEEDGDWRLSTPQSEEKDIVSS
ncbi:MAG TPA: hypothetical protein VLF93_07225 [Candidatus Saccharimonadales bacterium]|nr:hypothetical protein [Candidatus Saccharimonadales bacterium]